MISTGLRNGNATNNQPMCDVDVQSHASSSSWMQVVSTDFSILDSVCA
jgi:hypothetical protein